MCEYKDRVVDIVHDFDNEICQTAEMFSTTLRTTHPVGFVASVSALDYLERGCFKKKVKTCTVSGILGENNLKQDLLYSWLSSDWCQHHEWGRGVPNSAIIKKAGLTDGFQTWYISSEAKWMHLPELCTLITSWVDQNQSNANLFRFLERRECGVANEDLFPLKTAYMVNLFTNEWGLHLPDKARQFIELQSTAGELAIGQLCKDMRYRLKDSLVSSGLTIQVPETKKGEMRLTKAGEEYIASVILPYCVLVTNPEVIGTDDSFEKTRKLLLMDCDTFLEDRDKLKLMLERFGTSLCNRYSQSSV